MSSKTEKKKKIKIKAGETVLSKFKMCLPRKWKGFPEFELGEKKKKYISSIELFFRGRGSTERAASREKLFLSKMTDYAMIEMLSFRASKLAWILRWMMKIEKAKIQ